MGELNKLYRYNPNLPSKGRCLFMDIDILIVGDLGTIGGELAWQIKNDIQLGRPQNKKRGWYPKGRSSAVLNNALHATAACNQYYAADESQFEKYPGEQSWVYDCNAPNLEFFFQDLIVSFKKQ